MTRFLLLTVSGLMLATAIAPSTGWAQAPLPIPPTVDEAAPCQQIPDAIIPLKPPEFGGALAWRRVLGIEGIDRLVDLMPLADGGMVTIGDSARYTREKGAEPMKLYLARFDVNGKNVFENRIDIKNFVSVQSGAVLKDKIVVASLLRNDKNEDSAQIDYYDGAGRVKSKVVLSEPGLDFTPSDIIANADGESLTLAVMASKRSGKNKKNTYTVLFRIDGTGKVLSRREFLPGVPNRVEQLQRISGGQIVGAGRVEIEGGRESGWVLRTSKQGDLVSQRPYARGGQAQLLKAIDDGEGGLYTVGEAIPAGEGYRAAWIMRLNAEGGIIWQRFLTGKYSYRAVDELYIKDGRLQILMAGKPIADGGREHARIITFSTIGNILSDEALLEGTNAVPVRLLEHSVTGKRIIAGYAQTGFAQYGIPEKDKLATYDTWRAQLGSMATYADPCKAAQVETLDDNP